VTDKTRTDEAFRAKANTLLLADQPSTLRSRAADVREILSRNARRIRPILQLLTKVDLHGDGVGGNGLSWLDGIYRDGVDTFFVDKAPAWARRWKTLIEESDTQSSARAYEAATAWAVRQGLRNGSLYSQYGFDYADPSSHWMPPEIWKERRSGYQFEKDLPNAEHLYTDRAEAALRASLSGLREAVAAGDVWVGRKDLYFRRDEAEIRPEGVDQAQNELYRKVGRIQLPTLLLELDSQVHFSWKLLGREPKTAEELLGVYGALLAAGTDLQSRGVATMIRGVHESTIRRYMRLFESEPALREANDALLHFARSHSIVNHWGTGFEASSDLMSLDASKHLYDARVDPKRRVHGIGVYQTVLDQWGIPYDQPLPLLRRQVGAALEGVVRQRVTPIRSLAVDTHGHVVIWTPRRFRRRSLNQPIYMCVCFRRSGYASHQEAYVERRDIDHSDRRVGHTGRRGKRVSCVPVRSRVLAQHEYRLCARSFPLVAVPRRATPELVRDQARPYRRVPTVSPSRDNAASVAVYRAEACGRR
jgi:hypothetical protein